MASFCSRYASCQETTNFARICRIVVDVLRDVLWQVLIHEIPPADLPKRVQTNQNNLRNLDVKVKMWLCGISSSSSEIPIAEKFDVSSLYVLIRNLCSQVPAPSNQWGKPPPPSGTNLGDDIERVREFRNTLYGHATMAKLQTAIFNKLSRSIKNVVSRFDLYFSSNCKAMKCDFEREIVYILLCSMDKSLEDAYINKMKEITMLSDDLEMVKQQVGIVKQQAGIVRQEVGDAKQQFVNVKQQVGDVELEVDNLRQEVANVKQEVGHVKQILQNEVDIVKKGAKADPTSVENTAQVMEDDIFRGDASKETEAGSHNLGLDVLSHSTGMSADEMEIIDGCFSLNKNQIDLQEAIGVGHFESVYKGMCTITDGTKIPVAVKILMNEKVTPGIEPELINEAKLMQHLSHKNIICMIGLCNADCIMLVLEFPPLGSLNSYLSNHKETMQGNIVELMWQVAMGMEYLESKKVIHRYLAARNVFLFTEHFAKVGGFEMSRALGRESDYYEAEQAGRWPLKWFAPECVFYWKFDSKSDVWSYGITLWEATSYGAKPYDKMKGREILKFLVEDCQRLEKPPDCPDDVYNVMLHCWEYEEEHRPTFGELATIMEELYHQMSL